MRIGVTNKISPELDGASSVARRVLPGDEMWIEAPPVHSQELTCWEALDHRARMVVSRKGQIVAAGRSALSALARGVGIRMRDDRLSLTGAGAKAALTELLGTPVGAATTQLVALPHEEGHWIIRATGIGPDKVAIMLLLADSSAEPQYAELEDALGLTPSEAQVAKAMLKGETAPGIAQRLGISVHTVRAHLRHCYDKLGVSTREELWHLLSRYRLS